MNERFHEIEIIDCSLDYSRYPKAKNNPPSLRETAEALSIIAFPASIFILLDGICRKSTIEAVAGTLMGLGQVPSAVSIVREMRRHGNDRKLAQQRIMTGNTSG